MLANFADTPKRREIMGFAGYFLESAHAPLIEVNTPDITHADQLAARPIAVGEGSTDIDSLLKAVPNAQLLRCASATTCIESVLSGGATAYWTTRVNMPGYIRVSRAMLKEASFTFRGAIERWAVAIPLGDPLIKAFVDEVVASALETGNISFKLFV